MLDAVSEQGVAALKLPPEYPYRIDYAPCRRIAVRAYDAGLHGVACRSNAECTRQSWLGEELALFDNAPRPHETAERLSFDGWYPDVQP